MAEFSIKTTQIKTTSDHFQDIRAEMDRIKSECSDVKKNLGLGFSLGSPYRLRLMAVNASLAQETTRMRRMQDGLYDIAERYELADNRNCDTDRDIVGIGAEANTTLEETDTLNAPEMTLADFLKHLVPPDISLPLSLTPQIELGLIDLEMVSEVALNELIEFGALDSIIEELSGISKEQHYNRNQYMPVEDFPATYEEAVKKEYLVGWNTGVPASCHQYTAEDGPNFKYVSQDGRYEIIYDCHGNLVTAPEDCGTYNFGNPDNYVDHFCKDVLTWIIWGNSPDDSTTPTERFNAFIVKGAVDGFIDWVF